MKEVIPNVYTAAASEVQDPNVVAQFAAVLGCCESSAASLPRIVYGAVRKPDGVKWTEKEKDFVANFIEEGLKAGKVLIFSDNGISRCGAAVVAYLVKCGMSPEEAMNVVRDKGLKPNPKILGVTHKTTQKKK